MPANRRFIRIITTTALSLTLVPLFSGAIAGKKAATTEATAAPASPAVVKPAAPPVPPVDTITYEEVDKYVKYYSGLGMHRAGTRIDKRAARWLTQELKRAKLSVDKETFTFNRPESRYAVVSMKVDRLNSVILPGMPLLNARPTNKQVSAKLGFVGQEGTVPVIHIYVTPTSGNAELRAKSIKEFKDAIESGKYQAVIGVTQGGYAGLLPLSIDLDENYKTPAMLMSGEIGNYAEIYAEINNPVKFLTRMRTVKSTADNIVAKIEGSDPKLGPVVVIAPRTAWWYAASERGSGVAVFLASAKALANSHPKRTIYFVSTAGQEYYSLGLKKFLQQHPELVKTAYSWIYLGGNIGTKPEPHFTIQGSSRTMRRLVHTALKDYGFSKINWMAEKPALLPQFRPIFDNSDHAVIIVATNNRCERMTCDKYPNNVNIEATFNFAKATTIMLQRLANE